MRVETSAEQILREALAEDEREGSCFDAEGFSNYFLEDWRHDPEAVEEAWSRYRELWSIR